MGTELMVPRSNGQSAPPRLSMSETFAALGLGDIWGTANCIIESGMFPDFKKPEQVVVLMLLCDAENLHYIQALRKYHIIKGRPALRADWMQAEFQRRGGRIKWVQSDCEACEAVFSHRKYHPDGLTIRLELKRFVDSRVAMTWNEKSSKWVLKDNWANYPDAMLRARVITAGVRAVDPAVVSGMYPPEEMQDIVDAEERRDNPFIPPPTIAEKITQFAGVIEAISPKPTPAAVEPPVWGQPDEIDARPYHEVVSTAVGMFNSRVEQLTGKAGDYKGADVHRPLWVRANQLGWDDGESPKSLGDAIKRLTKLYTGDHRKGLREALQKHIDDGWDVVESAYIDEQAEAAEGPAPADEDKPLEGNEAGLDG